MRSQGNRSKMWTEKNKQTKQNPNPEKEKSSVTVRNCWVILLKSYLKINTADEEGGKSRWRDFQAWSLSDLHWLGMNGRYMSPGCKWHFCLALFHPIQDERGSRGCFLQTLTRLRLRSTAETCMSFSFVTDWTVSQIHMLEP